MKRLLTALLIASFASSAGAEQVKPSCDLARETLVLTEQKLSELENLFKETTEQKVREVSAAQGRGLIQLREAVKEFIRLNCLVVSKDGK